MKLNFEDVPNSTDSRNLFDKYAYGGTYDLAVVKFNVCRELNRDDINIPERAEEKDPSKKKR